MKLVIGLVGEKGSGKGTFAKFLQDLALRNSLIRIRFSDVLFETLKLWDIPPTRSNLQNLATTMEKKYGSGTMAKSAKGSIDKLTQEIVVIDGLRRWQEEKMIRGFPKSLIVYITADEKTRHKNLTQKSDKLKERKVSFEQFMREEKAEPEVRIAEIGKSADYKILNTGTLNELKIQAEKFYKEFVRPWLERI